MKEIKQRTVGYLEGCIVNNTIPDLDHSRHLIEKYKNFKQSIEKIPTKETKFKVGDSVLFTNENEIVFGPYKIMGFESNDHPLFKYGNFICLDKPDDAYWFPHKEDELELFDPETYPLTVPDGIL